ncbi:MAG: hypothetical protein F6K44_22725 [Moorea sp. SIO3E2]|nr:hypothetical protein [Moorena sp. SIO3E2]
MKKFCVFNSYKKRYICCYKSCCSPLFPVPFPCSLFPIPDSRFPIPDSRFPTSSLFADPKHPSIHPQYN